MKIARIGGISVIMDDGKLGVVVEEDDEILINVDDWETFEGMKFSELKEGVTLFYYVLEDLCVYTVEFNRSVMRKLGNEYVFFISKLNCLQQYLMAFSSGVDGFQKMLDDKKKELEKLKNWIEFESNLN